VMQEVIFNNLPYRSSEQETPKRLIGLCPYDEGSSRVVAIVPLRLDNNPIGTLWIARCDPVPYSETDLIWLECMADQVVIAIQHGLMTSQLQSLSVVEERARIAREMHDGLAQVLGYLNLQVQTLDMLLQKGKMDSLSKELRHLREAVQTAHADVRENILSLRTTLAHETGLVAAMVEYIGEFSIQTGIEVQLLNQAGDDLELSSIAEVQLVCILQEALTNVRKHSQAAHVDVQIARENGNANVATGYIPGATSFIRMTVEDDGKGFDLNTSKRSFGLQTMRERAQSVGGDLTVTSWRGKGTQLELHLPCVEQEAVKKRSLVLS
jgi:nitrate/nitrite-specific signal transduction histidine kinase